VWNEAWPSLEIVNLNNSLKALQTIVEDHDPSEPASAELARFLVVRTCGYLERCVEVCCVSYVRSKSDTRSSSFGASWFGTGANPSPGALIKLVSRFDADWARDFESVLSERDEVLKREIAFLVDIRNKISHGRSQNIGKRKALDLVGYTRTVADWFVRQFDPR